MRLACNTSNYFCFDGSRKGASANNNVYVSLWTALTF